MSHSPNDPRKSDPSLIDAPLQTGNENEETTASTGENRDIHPDLLANLQAATRLGATDAALERPSAPKDKHPADDEDKADSPPNSQADDLPDAQPEPFPGVSGEPYLPELAPLQGPTPSELAQAEQETPEADTDQQESGENTPKESADEANAACPVTPLASAPETVADTEDNVPSLETAVEGTIPSDGIAENEGNDDDDDEEEEEEEEEEDPSTTGIRGHLRELRKRLFWAFITAFAGCLVCLPFADKLFHYLQMPVLTIMADMNIDRNFIMTGMAEGFFTELKVAFVAGIFLFSPLVFYQFWAFISPGLYKEEKRYILPVAIASAVFFVTGAAFCYFITFPFAFQFFMSYDTETNQIMLTLSEYLSFTLTLLMAFGLVFEMPLAVFFLARIGLLTAATMRRVRRYAILGCFVVAAILTPPDVFSQLLMAGPLLLLYELSIFIAWMFGKKETPEHEPEEADTGKTDTESSGTKKPDTKELDTGEPDAEESSVGELAAGEPDTEKLDAREPDTQEFRSIEPEAAETQDNSDTASTQVSPLPADEIAQEADSSADNAPAGSDSDEAAPPVTQEDAPLAGDAKNGNDT